MVFSVKFSLQIKRLEKCIIVLFDDLIYIEYIRIRMYSLLLKFTFSPRIIFVINVLLSFCAINRC